MERLGHSMQRGSYLLLGFKREVTRYNFRCRKISSALFWGWTEGHNSICKFNCSSLRPPVPVSALFYGRHLSPDHTAFYLFTCSLPTFLTGMKTPQRHGYVCIPLWYLQCHHNSQQVTGAQQGYIHQLNA